MAMNASVMMDIMEQHLAHLVLGTAQHVIQVAYAPLV